MGRLADWDNLDIITHVDRKVHCQPISMPAASLDSNPVRFYLTEAERLIYASVKHANISSDNGLSPVWRQTII